MKLTTAAAGATGVDYRLFFSATSGLAATNASVTVTMPTGTSLAKTNVVVIDLHTNAQLQECCNTLSNSDRTVKVPVSRAGAGDPLEVWLENVANPSSAASSEHITVSTSSDTTPVPSAAYSIVASHAISAPSVSLTTAAEGATGVDYHAAFTLSSTGALTGSGDSVTFTGPSGTSFARAGAVVFDRSRDDRQVQVCCNSLSNSNRTLNVPVQGAAAGDQLSVVLQNVANPPAIATGEHLSVFTSSDHSAVSSAAYSIVASHAISAPTVSLTTAAEGATGVDYHTVFTLSSTGALTGTGDSITFTAPSGTSFVHASALVFDRTQDRQVQVCCNSVSNSNRTLNVPVQGAAAGDQVSAVLQDVSNPPSVLSGQRLSVFTSSDFNPVSSAAYSIVASHHVSTPHVSLSNSAAHATGVTYSIGFTLSSTGALTGSGDSITIAAPTGTSFASSSVTVYDESQDASQIQICCSQLSNGNATINVPLVGAAAGDQLTVVLTSSVNPAGGPGTRKLTVRTTSDPIAATSGSY